MSDNIPDEDVPSPSHDPVTLDTIAAKIKESDQQQEQLEAEEEAECTAIEERYAPRIASVRLTRGKLFIDAKALCVAQGIAFKKWCEAQGYGANKLSHIYADMRLAGADDPDDALAQKRAQSAARTKNPAPRQRRVALQPRM
jgi:hypothetical protein